MLIRQVRFGEQVDSPAWRIWEDNHDLATQRHAAFADRSKSVPHRIERNTIGIAAPATCPASRRPGRTNFFPGIAANSSSAAGTEPTPARHMRVEESESETTAFLIASEATGLTQQASRVTRHRRGLNRSRRQRIRSCLPSRTSGPAQQAGPTNDLRSRPAGGTYLEAARTAQVLLHGRTVNLRHMSPAYGDQVQPTTGTRRIFTVQGPMSRGIGSSGPGFFGGAQRRHHPGWTKGRLRERRTIGYIAQRVAAPLRVLRSPRLGHWHASFR